MHWQLYPTKKHSTVLQGSLSETLTENDPDKSELSKERIVLLRHKIFKKIHKGLLIIICFAFSFFNRVKRVPVWLRKPTSLHQHPPRRGFYPWPCGCNATVCHRFRAEVHQAAQPKMSAHVLSHHLRSTAASPPSSHQADRELGYSGKARLTGEKAQRVSKSRWRFRSYPWWRAGAHSEAI